MVRANTIFYLMGLWFCGVMLGIVMVSNSGYSSVDPFITFAKPQIETLFTPPNQAEYNALVHKAAQLDRIEENDEIYLRKKFIKEMDIVTLHAMDPKMVKEKMESKETNIVKEIDEAIKKIAKKHGMDSRLIMAMVMVESEKKHKAVSKENARGLMQIVPDTARKLGVKDTFNPVDNLDGGIRYIKYLVKVYNGNLQLALAAYNAGPGRVQEYGNQIPPFKETQEYVVKVIEKYEKYKRG